MATTTRQGLIEYCLRELGDPVVEINVDEEQVEDRIDEAIEYYRQYHYDGIEKVYLKHQLTQEDLDQGYIKIPDLIYGVVRVLPFVGGQSSSRNMFDLQYQLRLNDLYDLTSTSIIYYKQVMQHISLLDLELNGKPLFRFNRINGKLFVDVDLKNKLTLGSFLVVECYRVLDPAEAPKLYNEQWLKHYATALIKKQWATNMKKFQGLQLPGGVSIDAQSLYQEAIQEIKDLQDDLINKQGPLEFFMG